MRPISPAQRKVLDALIEAHPRAATHQFIHAALWREGYRIEAHAMSEAQRLVEQRSARDVEAA